MNIVEQLLEAVSALELIVNSGRFGFDYAVKEYVESHDSDVAKAFEQYVSALKLNERDPDAPSIPAESEQRLSIRRNVLRKIAEELNVPEAVTLTEALIKSQDEGISLPNTLAQQADLLRQATK